jgi:hypothetical protein
MVAYSFNPRFIEPIRQGLKTQSIRARGLRRHARKGELIQLYSGMRTAHCQRILPDVPCLEVMSIEIIFDPGDRPLIGRITTDGIRVLSLDDFATRDGFTDSDDMAAFWRATHGPLEVFHGLVIEWAMPRAAVERVAA